MAELIDLKKDFNLGNVFLLNTAKELSKILTDNYRIIVKYDHTNTPYYSDNKLNIVFSLSREVHATPKDFNRADVVKIFQNYFMLDNWGYPVHNKKVYPLPLGSFVECNDIILKPIRQRKYDFSFIGQIPHTGTRDKFKRCLDDLIKNTGNKYKYYIKYTNGFNQGLDKREYLELLNDTKISLCPCGAFSHETFRFFEAIMMGSFPAVESLPKLWYYECAPMFFMHWQFLDKNLSTSLNMLNTEDINSQILHMMNYNYNILNPKNLAKILKEKI